MHLGQWRLVLSNCTISLLVSLCHYVLTLNLWISVIVIDRSSVTNIKWCVCIVLWVKREVIVALLTFVFFRIWFAWCSFVYLRPVLLPFSGSMLSEFVNQTRFNSLAPQCPDSQGQIPKVGADLLCPLIPGYISGFLKSKRM
jgi:hypothetical protein